jgi:VWFA-related protein
MMIRTGRKALPILAVAAFSLTAPFVRGQERARDRSGQTRGSAKPVTVPVTIRVRESKPEIEMRTVDFLLREDGEMQTILSIRRPSENPISLAILIQDDLVSSVGTETKGLANFIRQLPGGSRIMTGYIRSGSLEVRRKFTTDIEKAAANLRPPMGLASASPFNPFVEIIEALRRFDSQPLGRRAIIVVSDGLDVSRGIDSSAPGQSLDLQRAITEAQRRSVAIYSIYAPPAAASGNQLLSANGQSCLEKLSSETGGRAYFQGTGAPVSFDPFLKEIDASLARQIALTYLSTHTGKGFHRLDIKPLERDVEIRHPAGYTR